MTELAYQTPLLPKPEPIAPQPLVSSFAELVKAQFVTVRQSDHGIEALEASRHEHEIEAERHAMRSGESDERADAATGSRRVADLVAATVRANTRLRNKQAEIYTLLELLAPHEETIRGLIGAPRQ